LVHRNRVEIWVPEGTAEALKPALMEAADWAAVGAALAAVEMASLATRAAGAAADMLRPAVTAALAE
jgi:hypothetical protein